MNTYAKHYPNKCTNCDCKRVLRRQSANVPTSDSQFGVDLTEKPDAEQIGEENDDVAKAEELINKSLIRFRDAVVPQVGSSRKTVRIIWIIIYLGLFVFFSFSFANLVVKYATYPVSIDLTVETRSNLPFPAVTVCNENPVRKSLIGRLRKYSELASLDDYIATLVDKNANRNINDQKSKNTLTKCPYGYFQCKTSGDCIPSDWICDRKIQCKDKSDENFTQNECVELESKKPKPRGNFEPSEMCEGPFISCNSDITGTDKVCAKQCDQISECYNDIDETDYDSDCASTIHFEADLKAVDDRYRTLRFPEKLQSYDSETTIAWTISAGEGETVSINIIMLDIEECIYVSPGSGLCQDVLQISEGNCTGRLKEGLMVMRSTYCVPVSPNHFCNGYDIDRNGHRIYNSSIVTIFFFSDVNHNFGGFEFQYKAVKSSNKTKVKIINDSCPDYHKKWRNYLYKRDIRGIVGYSEACVGSCANAQPDQLSDKPSKNEIPLINSTNLFSYFAVYRTSTRNDFADFQQSVFFDQSIISLYGHKGNDFIVQCSFDNQNCFVYDFNRFEDPTYGNCFTFNSLRNAGNKVTSKIGKDYGLKLTLFVDAKEYVGLLAQNTGVRVAIHDPNIEPIMRTQSMSISVGEATFLSLKLQEIHRLGSKYSECNANWDSEKGLSDEYKRMEYSLDRCLQLCILRHLVDRCNCIDSYDFKFSASQPRNFSFKLCSHTDERARYCRKAVYDDYANMKIRCSSCLPPCHSTEFLFTASRSHWPSTEYGPYFASKLFDQKSGRLVEFAKRFKNNTKSFEKLIKEDVRENFVRLEVFYNSLRFRSFNETASYEFVDLLSDFGGNISLWLGWSVFALFELLIFFVHCFQAAYIKYKD